MQHDCTISLKAALMDDDERKWGAKHLSLEKANVRDGIRRVSIMSQAIKRRSWWAPDAIVRTLLDIIASHCSYIIVRYKTSICWMAKSNKSIISQREWDKKLKIWPQHNIEWMIDSNPQKQNWSSIQTPWRYRIFKLFAGPNSCKRDKIWSCDEVESAVGLS